MPRSWLTILLREVEAVVEIDDHIERLRVAFRRFGEIEATAQGSPIYERLSRVVAADADLLAVAAEARPAQPVPNLFFGAVHALLNAEPADALAVYYPSLGGGHAIDGGLDAAFRTFVLRHRSRIAGVLRARLVQTNEVRRSVALLPAFATAANDAGGAPLALIEVGPAAGLNLLFDRYRYDYSGSPAGDAGSPLCLATEVRREPPPTRIPEVASRFGIDLNALDVRSEEDMTWLRALLWPEHAERRAVLDAAISIARRDPPSLVSGDVFQELPSAIRQAPPGAAVVVFATFVLNQFIPEMRERFRGLLVEASHERPVRLVTVGYQDYFAEDIGDDGSAEVWLATLDGGRATARRLARTSPHGWWVEWAPEAPRGW